MNVNELINEGTVNEWELTEFIRTYQKMIELDILSKESLSEFLTKIEIENTEPNTYILSEDIMYHL